MQICRYEEIKVVPDTQWIANKWWLESITDDCVCTLTLFSHNQSTCPTHRDTEDVGTRCNKKYKNLALNYSLMKQQHGIQDCEKKNAN